MDEPMPDTAPPQFHLSTMMMLVIMAAVVLGILRLPPNFSAFILTLFNVLALVYLTLGAVATKPTHRLIYLGSAIGLGAMLYIGHAGRIATPTLQGNLLQLLMMLTGRDQLGVEDYSAFQIVIWQLFTLLAGGLGALAGFIHIQRQR